MGARDSLSTERWYDKKEERTLKVPWKPRGISISPQVSLVHLAYSSRALVAGRRSLLHSVICDVYPHS